jgi:hypothetical protein
MTDLLPHGWTLLALGLSLLALGLLQLGLWLEERPRRELRREIHRLIFYYRA